MSDSQTDVVIVGAGPAGSAAATFLAREGLEVLVVDRAVFPRDKVCGDGLTPRAVAVLQRLGVDARLRHMGIRPLREYRAVTSRGHEITIPFSAPREGPDYGYVMPRRELDLLLVETARAAGAVVWEGTRALNLERDSFGRPVVVCRRLGGDLFRLRARVLIAADGSRGSFSRTLLPSRRLEPSAIGIRAYMEQVEGVDGALNFFLERHLLPGYGWIFPGAKEGAPANVGVLVRTAALRRSRLSLRALFNGFLASGSLAWPHLRHARLISAPAAFPLQMDFRKARRPEDSVLFLGDAAGLVNPLSGQGIGSALESAQAAARAIVSALRAGESGALSEYQTSVSRVFSPQFLGAVLVRGLLAQPWGNGLGNEIIAGLVRCGGPVGRAVSGGFWWTVG